MSQPCIALTVSRVYLLQRSGSAKSRGSQLADPWPRTYSTQFFVERSEDFRVQDSVLKLRKILMSRAMDFMKRKFKLYLVRGASTEVLGCMEYSQGKTEVHPGREARGATALVPLLLIYAYEVLAVCPMRVGQISCGISRSHSLHECSVKYEYSRDILFSN